MAANNTSSVQHGYFTFAQSAAPKSRDIQLNYHSLHSEVHLSMRGRPTDVDNHSGSFADCLLPVLQVCLLPVLQVCLLPVLQVCTTQGLYMWKSDINYVPCTHGHFHVTRVSTPEVKILHLKVESSADRLSQHVSILHVVLRR